ncbi:hypothetical protein NBRC3280_1405 [Acetobacter pasteurianus NBRC 3280]|uniref:Uncharacterized protein n=1 Tax=Acetobacter pasteurianus NBRC 3278 TaxID=1226660 RepID=A0A401X3Q5_ACEPA|nr:hypothetical protein NBRC3277_1481 [Acetobacter pasteurianus NBRC 3277]GCD62398.1 hypothetical protein NBRC3278_1491 [Acetobacter pasteurianus NBRC 3278]GCD68770.1 hypothetical protein NBRC3280_1405 [Acetobacter pasteurianus NBRC 3280]
MPCHRAWIDTIFPNFLGKDWDYTYFVPVIWEFFSLS